MKYREVIFMVVSPTFASLMIILNSAILALVKFSKNQTKCRKLIYIMNLSVADLFLGVNIILVKAMSVVEKSHPQKNSIKNVRHFLQGKLMPLSLYISVLSVAVITFDRLLMVLQPIKYMRIRHWKKRAVCVCVWIMATSTVLGMYFLVNDNKQEYILTPCLVLLTVVFVSASYFKIQRHLSSINSITLNRRSGGGVGNKATGITLSERRFTQFCFQSFVLFVVCWLPFSVYGILYVTNMIDTWSYYLDFRYTCHIMAFSNSVFSPILFLFHFKRLQRSKSTTNKYEESVATSTFSELPDINNVQ